MSAPFRILTFADRPDALVVVSPDARPVSLPELTPPFDRGSVATALSAAGIKDVRVIEVPTAGRWTSSIMRAHKDAKAERGSKVREAALDQHRLMLSSVDDVERHRAELVLEKSAVDDRLRQRKIELSAIKTNAAVNGKFIKRENYLAILQEIEDLRLRSQRIQGSIREVNKLRAERRAVSHERWVDAFKQLVAEALGKDEFEALCDAATEMTHGSDPCEGEVHDDAAVKP